MLTQLSTLFPLLPIRLTSDVYPSPSGWTDLQPFFYTRNLATTDGPITQYIVTANIP
jgi:hypothetical protein